MSVKIITAAEPDTQGARALRAEEYVALTDAIDACRRFTGRQTRESYREVVMALNRLGVIANWNKEYE